MTNPFAAPRTIRRIAARRVFERTDGKPVVLTIGVPRRVPGSDWGCALQITGLPNELRRPQYVFGIDALQALYLAMKRADAVLQAAKPRLVWLGEKGDLGLPKFLPELPKPQRDRLEAIMEREARKLLRTFVRGRKAAQSFRLDKE